jgi:hypothetical protein
MLRGAQLIQPPPYPSAAFFGAAILPVNRLAVLTL